MWTVGAVMNERPQVRVRLNGVEDSAQIVGRGKQGVLLLPNGRRVSVDWEMLAWALTSGKPVEVM